MMLEPKQYSILVYHLAGDDYDAYHAAIGPFPDKAIAADYLKRSNTEMAPPRVEIIAMLKPVDDPDDDADLHP